MDTRLSVGFLALTLMMHATSLQSQTAQRFFNRDLATLGQSDGGEDRYNLRWGRVTGRLSAGFDVDLNDNINLSEDSPEPDAIISPDIGVGFLWPLSENNVLRFDLGAGYRAYVDHNELNSFYVLPGSQLNLRARLWDVRLNVYDELTVETDPISQPEVGGTGEATLDFRRISNVSGLTATWQASSDWSFSGNFEFGLDRSLSEEFEELDRVTFGGNVAAQVTLSPRWRAGIMGSVEALVYDQPIQNDGLTLSTGPTFSVEASRFITITGFAGYSRMTFEQTGTVMDDSDYGGFTMQLGAVHRMSSRSTQSLEAMYGPESGFGSNFTEIFRVTYGLRTRVYAGVTLNFIATYERFRTSGPEGEQADRLLTQLGTEFQLTRYWSLGVQYAYNLRNSELPDRDFGQNRLALQFRRAF